MGFFFGKAPSVKTSAPIIASLRGQTSTYAGAIPIVFGMPRVAANLMQYEDFTAIAHTETQSSGGKGGGGGGKSSNTTYTYTALLLLRLAHGTLGGVARVWKDKNQTTLTGLGLTFFNGSYSQNAFGALVSRHPDRALAYRGISYVAHEAFDLGESATIGNLNFEVNGLKPYGGVGRIIREVRLRQGPNPWNRVSSALVQSSPDKSAWTTVTTISPANNGSLQVFSVPLSTSRPYWRLLANSNVRGWQGAWSDVTTYAVNDVVSHAGNLWRAIDPELGTPPDTQVVVIATEAQLVYGPDGRWEVMDGQAARWEVIALEMATAASGADLAIPQQASSSGDWNS